MSLPTPVRNLIEASAILREHAPAEISEWFDRGVVAHLENGERLDRSLLLTGPHMSRSAARYWRLARRGELLREARDIITKGGYLTTDHALLAAVKRFESTTWQRCQCTGDIPEGSSQLSRILFEAFRLGIGVPTSSLQRLRLAMDWNP